MSERPQRSQGRGGGRNRYFRRPKVDPFEADKTLVIDYKDTPLLKRFLTPEGKIRPRRQTGVNTKNQRNLAKAVKRARHIALLPYTDEKLD
jgi:small subunit ribosomal protein S18